MTENSGRTSPLLLVADDHHVNRVMIERILARLGYRTVLVENGREAVEAVRKGQFDGALLDIEMPVMDGLEAASAIRGREGTTGRLPLLALSAHSPGEFEHHARRHGFDGFIVKPINARDLAVTLARLIPVPAD
jgi:CheY-like chemotaxis protein